MLLCTWMSRLQACMLCLRLCKHGQQAVLPPTLWSRVLMHHTQMHIPPRDPINLAVGTQMGTVPAAVKLIKANAMASTTTGLMQMTLHTLKADSIGKAPRLNTHQA